MTNKNLKLKVLASIFILTLAIMSTPASVQNVQSLTVFITSKTNKETFYLREKVKIEGNITIDGSPLTNALILTEITDPSGIPIIYETIVHGNFSEPLPIEITDIYLTDFSNNPLNTVKTGMAIRVCMTIHNPQLVSREIFATVTVYDANMVPLQVGYLTTTINPEQTITPKFTVYIPEWATSGKALIVGNVYNDEPKSGGLAYALPKKRYYYLSRCQKGYLDLPELPLPQPQSTPGKFETYLTLPPDPRPGTYKVDLTCQVDPLTFCSTSTTFNVEQTSGYPPQASFIYWPAKPYVNMTVQFDASSSTPEGFNDTIIRYEWTSETEQK